MTKKHTGKTALMKFEDFPTEIPILGEAKVETPIAKYSMVNRNSQVLERALSRTRTGLRSMTP